MIRNETDNYALPECDLVDWKKGKKKKDRIGWTIRALPFRNKEEHACCGVLPPRPISCMPVVGLKSQL